MHTVHFILEENAVGLFLRNAENSKRWSEEPHLILYRIVKHKIIKGTHAYMLHFSLDVLSENKQPHKTSCICFSNINENDVL